jgi:hypothetical protein
VRSRGCRQRPRRRHAGRLHRAVAATGSSTILDLTLGPLRLNLLCAVAHLLDGGAGGNAISNLLNAILGALG